MLYACVNMIFWRVFMRISYTCPTHLKFSLTVEKWTNLTNITGDVIDWLDKHEGMYDVWLVISYAATSCALVQVSPSFYFLVLILGKATLPRLSVLVLLNVEFSYL